MPVNPYIDDTDTLYPPPYTPPFFPAARPPYLPPASAPAAPPVNGAGPGPVNAPDATAGPSPAPASPTDPLQAQKQKYAQAQQRLQQVQAGQPQIPKPKWWQQLGAVGAGALAGAENAGGHSRVPMDAQAMEQGILAPGYGLKQRIYQQQLAQAQGDVAESEKALKTGSTVQEEQARAGLYGDQPQARRDAAKIGADQRTEASKRTAFERFVKDGHMQLATDPVPPGYRAIPDIDDSRFVHVLPPPTGIISEDLVDHAPGHKVGDVVPYTEYAKAVDEAHKEKLKQTAPGVAPKPTTDPREVLLNPGNYTKEQVKEADRILNIEHRPPKDPNAMPTGDFPVRNPTLPANARDEQVLSKIDPRTATIVKQLADYKYPLPTGIALRTPEWQNILGVAGQYDPSFDASQYTQRQKLQNDFKSGQAARNIRNLNTVTQHLDRLEKNAQSLNNTNILPGLTNPVINAVGSKISSGTQNRLNKYQQDQQAVANELMRLWRETQGSEREIQDWSSKLSANLSPEAQAGAIQEAYQLIAGRLAALKNQYESGMGKPADFHILDQDTLSRFHKHGVDTQDLAPNATYWAIESPAPGGAAGAPGVVRWGRDAQGNPVRLSQ